MTRDLYLHHFPKLSLTNDELEVLLVIYNSTDPDSDFIADTTNYTLINLDFAIEALTNCEKLLSWDKAGLILPNGVAVKESVLEKLKNLTGVYYRHSVQIKTYEGSISIDTPVAKQMMLHFIQNNLMGDSLATILEIAAKEFPDAFFKVHEAKQFEHDMFSK